MGDITTGQHFRTQFTGEQEWYTPQRYIEAAREVLGIIDLDPASTLKAQQIVQARLFYSEDNDGLKHQWYGQVWLNPPYTQPLIQRFIEKLIKEHQSGRVQEAILLTHNYTDTLWFHKAQGACQLICFTRGRIKFINPHGDAASPAQGQAFFYFGWRAKRFQSVFKNFGFIR